MFRQTPKGTGLSLLSSPEILSEDPTIIMNIHTPLVTQRRKNLDGNFSRKRLAKNLIPTKVVI